MYFFFVHCTVFHFTKNFSICCDWAGNLITLGGMSVLNICFWNFNHSFSSFSLWRFWKEHLRRFRTFNYQINQLDCTCHSNFFNFNSRASSLPILIAPQYTFGVQSVEPLNARARLQPCTGEYWLVIPHRSWGMPGYPLASQPAEFMCSVPAASRYPAAEKVCRV